MNRTIKTIAGNIIHKKGKSSTNMPNAILHISVQFIVAISLMFFTFGLWWLRWFYVGDEVYNVIMVNTPQSYTEYAKENEIFINKNLMRTWDANYDYITFGRWMRSDDAYMTVVFPSNFDELVESGEDADILTYYRTNSLEYMYYKEDFIKNELEGYKQYIKEQKGITIAESGAVGTNIYGISTSKEDIHSAAYFTKMFARTFIPLVAFIIVLYLSMSSGTNVIAGEKERGTFAAILMSPAKRVNIVIGNILGVTIKALIPSVIFLLLVFIPTTYRSLSGVIGFFSVFLLLISLGIFIASITILISVLNDSVVSAQTAFLPIFLVMVAVCVTCIQSVGEAANFYYMLPVYGHFYGIGDNIIGEGNILNTIICLITSGLFSYLCIYISEKLLHMERFTVSGNQITDKEIRRAAKLVEEQSHDYVSKPRATIFDFKGTKRIPTLSFFSDQIVYPLVVLSIFQLLALIPTAIMYMRKPEYSQFIYSLKDVSGVPEVISKSFEIMAIFLGDPAFLIFMSIGYMGIIITYFLRVKYKEKGSYITLGLGGTNKLRNYAKGLALGLLLMGSVYLVLIITGQLTPSMPTLTAGNILTIFAGILMWLPQGAAEEVMFRGFMLPRQGARYGTKFALIFSSVLFAGFHSMNVGFTPLAFINLFLIAFFFALLDLYAGHIWYSCAAHTMWNFLQGNVFGLQVSGNQGAATLLTANYTSNAKDIITGGAFGPEGGLAVTFVTIVAIVILVVIKRRNKHFLHQN
ncbi:MAG: ABC transporter permease [Saccharofermentans sp.]|nr:ABC transporter permease [Saccharofermentans sp.]